MHLRRRFRHRCEKGTTTGELVRLAASALRAAGHGEVRFHALFADARFDKRSGVARLIARFPELVTAPVTAPTVLATLPADTRYLDGAVVGTIAPLELDAAIAIADGVPRTFPLHEAHFWVSPVPAFELTPAPRRTTVNKFGDAEVAELVVHSAARSTRREVEIRSAVVTTPPSPGAKRAAPLPAAVKALLDALGKPGKEEQTLIHDPVEEAALQARRDALRPQVEALTAALEASWATFAFPRTLTDDHRHEEHDMDVRAELAAALGAAGWSQTSGGFRVRTAADHELVLRYDRAPLGNQTSAWLTLRGADWEHGVTLWPRRDGKQLRIRSRATANAYATNIAAAAAHAIATWAAPIEALYGRGDAWLPRRR